MNSLDKSISNFIDKASKRIKINFLLNLSIVGLKLLLCLSLCLLLISLVITFPYVERISIGIVIIGLFATLIYGFFKAPNKKRVALIVDSKGLKERVTTSLELIGDEDVVSLAQKQDTVKAIESYDIKKNLKIEVDKKQIYMILALVGMCILTILIPTTAKKNAENIKEFHKYKNEIIEKIEKEMEKVDKFEGLDEKEKEEVKKILEDAKKELKESEKKSDLDKTLERLEKKLEKKKEELKTEEGKKDLDNLEKDLLEDFNKKKEEEAKKDLNKIVNELMKKEESKELAEALMSDDEEKLNKALKDLKNSLSNMSSAELSKLSESLKKASGQVLNEDLAQALSEASSSVLDGELNTGDLSEALASAKKASKKSEGQGEGSGEGEGQGEGEGSGEGEGAGQGDGQGQGSGQGQGQGGGWNTGSDTGTENDIENKPGEEIFIPGREQGDDGNLSGSINENGESQQVQIENGLNIDGSKVDYDKVIGDYTNSALEGANNSNLPESLKNLIKDYFEGLN